MISAKWDITSTCNLRCSHCSVADMYFKDITSPNLSLSDRLHIIDNLAEGGVTYLSLLGGEPLTLGNQLFSILRRAQEHQIRVNLVTNGQLLDYDTSRRLLDHGLSGLVVSIESSKPEIHNQIRGKLTFERLIGNLETFLNLRGDGNSPQLVINTVLCRPNRDTFIEMIPFSRDFGADSWTALTLNYIGNAVEHLDNLALSEEEHTEIALEIGQLLSSPGFDSGHLKVNLTIVCPLVWEYLCKKHDIRLPQPEICCSASSSLIYISPTGEMHLCDRVNSSGFTGMKLESETMRPMSLLTNSFEDIWNSKQFLEMFEFVKRSETYAGFDPCNHCKYMFDRTCNPCPLQSYRSSNIQFEECLKAEAYLGDISQYDAGPRTTWEQIHQFERLPLPTLKPEEYELFQDMYPIGASGIRHVVQPDGDALLMHPRSLELIKLNLMGSAIWETMNGLVTTEEVVEAAADLYRETSILFNVTLDSERLNSFKTQYVRPFIISLHNKQFLTFNTSQAEGNHGNRERTTM